MDAGPRSDGRDLPADQALAARHRPGPQPIFFRYAGATAGGGPIENWAIKRTRISGPPHGYFAIRIAGNGDDYVPTRIRLRRLRLTADVSIDRGAFRSGFEASGLRGGRVLVSDG